MSNDGTTVPQQGRATGEMLRVFQSRDEIRAFYDKIAKVYDLLAEHSESPMRQAGLDLLAANTGERVLEIGFGTGHCILALAKSVGPTGKVLGIDLSDQMVQLALERVEAERLSDRIELARGDATRLPYPGGKMDAIFMSFTLELFDTPEIPVVLGECKRVLRPGGRVVVVGMSKEGEHGLILEIFEWSHRHFPNFVDCRPIFVRRMIEDAGFTIEKVEKRSMWVPVEIVLAKTRAK